MQPQERDRGGVGHGGCARQTRWAPRPGQAEDGQGRSEAQRAEAIERLLDPEALPKTWLAGRVAARDVLWPRPWDVAAELMAGYEAACDVCMCDVQCTTVS